MTFKRTVMAHWRRQGRHDLPWRKTRNPYAILVSELMLQQTQVDRVVPFYRAFLARFPSFEVLARARGASVLKVWQGLGYNRRALMLRRCAKKVVSSHGGELPDSFDELVELPGLGAYTAGAVLAFAFNKPHPMIETNIRRVYIHHFFPRAKEVSDDRIVPLVERTMNRRNPGEWFGALMDYGSWLAKRVPNPNKKSRHYTRQSSFEGSSRQVRGRILRELLNAGSLSMFALKQRISDARCAEIVSGMERDGLVRIGRGRVSCV